MKTIVLMALALVLSACGGARADNKDDGAKFNGKWVAIALSGDGIEVPAATLKEVPWYWIIDGNKILSKRPGSGGKVIHEEKLSFVLDAAAKPMTFDLTDTEKKETFKCICSLDGDELKICFATDKEAARPTGFSTAKGSKRMLMVWKKVKE